MPRLETPDTVQDLHRDPYAYFAQLRESDPVTWSHFFEGPAWVVTGYPEAAAIMKDARFVREAPFETFSSRSPRVAEALEMKRRMILVRDAPFHTRVRSFITRAFTPGTVARKRAAIESAATALLDRALERGTCDLMADFARPLPLHVVCDLIGVPETERDRAVAWSLAMLTFIDFHSTAGDLSRASDAMLEARAFLTALVEARRRAPSDDLISDLLRAATADRSVSDEEIVATCLMLISAGHETTMNLIGNGYWLLHTHPEQAARLKADPSLMTNAVEEILRYDSPVLTTSRWVSTDMECFGHAMMRGQFVILALGACNRDPRVFDDPDRFDITRPQPRHLSFGSGVHFCVGAALARLEGAIALQALLTRLDNAQVLAEPQWAPSVALRGFDALHIRTGHTC